MQDMYPNLPGHIADFQDGGLKVKTDPNPPSTESIVLLGTSVDGPLLEPVAVDPGTVELVFGSGVRANGLPNGSTLVKGFEQAYAAGCRDIRLMRITGAYATGQASADPATTATDIGVDESLGLAPGNASVTFPLNNTNIIPSSVVVNANGVKLSPNAFTINTGNPLAATPTMGSIVLNPNVTDSQASIFISYQYVDANGNTVSAVANGYLNPNGVFQYFVATGNPIIFPLPSAVKPGTLTLYANGVAVNAKGYFVTTDGMGIQLEPGFVALGAALEATYINSNISSENPTIQIRSVYAGAVYNNVQIAVKDIVNSASQSVGKQIEITKPDAKKGQIAEAPLVYSSLDFPNFQLMVNAINADPSNNVVLASVANRFQTADSSTLTVAPPAYLIGGDDGLTSAPDELYAALGGKRDANGFLIQPGAYQLLENYTVDNVVPLGIYADQKLAGKYDNFANQLALACAVMTFRNYTTVGHIATSSPDQLGLQAVNNSVNALLANKNNYYMRDLAGNIIKDSQGNNMDLGRYINVIAGPDLTFSSQRFGLYAENSAAAYAGFVSNLPFQSAPTNKALPFVVGLRYQYSNAQLDALTGARYVTFRTKNNGATVAVTDAMTAAQPASDYKRLSTVRVVKEAVNQLRIVADPFLGEPNEVPQQNALSAAIAKRLDLLKQSKVIVDYEFHIIATPTDKILGQAQIELTIVPPQELRRLTTVVSLSPGQ